MTENTNNSQNSGQLVFLVLAFIAGVFAMRLWTELRGGDSPKVPEEITTENVETAEDSPVVLPETEEATDTPEEETTEAVDEEALVTEEDTLAIREALANKHSKDLEDVTLRDWEEDTTGSYVTGGVSLGEGPGNAGMFWAYKEDGEWLIAADGNGNPECTVLESAGFPEDMQEGCF